MHPATQGAGTYLLSKSLKERLVAHFETLNLTQTFTASVSIPGCPAYPATYWPPLPLPHSTPPGCLPTGSAQTPSGRIELYASTLCPNMQY